MKKNFILTLTAATLVMAGSSWAYGQRSEPKEILAISLSSYDELIGDINFLGSLGGHGDLSAMAEGQIEQHLGPGALQSLDKSRDWGAVVLTDGVQFTPIVFLPVTDAKQLLDALAGMIGPAEDAGGGTWRINAGTMPLRVKEQGGWAFLTQDTAASALDNLPADPTAWLKGMNTSYDVGIRLSIHNVPEQYRAQAMMFMQMGMNAAAQQRTPDESDEQFAMRQQMMKMQMDQMGVVLNEMDQMLVGLAVDQSAMQAYLDAKVTVVPGSKLAADSAADAHIDSEFAGLLLPDAAIQMHAASKVSEYDISQAESYLEPIRTVVMQAVEEEAEVPSEELRAKLKSIVGDLIDMYVATIRSGKIDFAFSTRLGGDGLVAVAGAHLADQDKLDKILRECSEMASQDPNFPGIKFDADSHGGVSFHTMSVPIPEDEEEPRKIFGENLEVVVGIGPQKAYFAVGKNSLATLKQAMDAKGPANLPAARYLISLVPILEFARSVDEGADPTLAAVLQAVSSLKGKDHIIFTGAHIDHGQEMRFLLEEGVLKAIGAAVQANH